MASATTFYDFKPKDKKGNEFPLKSLDGKVVLVVNTASKCGFTPQFEGLEKLYKGLPIHYTPSLELQRRWLARSLPLKSWTLANARSPQNSSPRTQTSKSSASRATNSPPKTRAATRKSSPSASSTTASASPCSARRT